MIYCWSDIFNGPIKIGSRKPTLRGNVFDDLLIGQPLGNASTLLLKRQVVDRVGGFDTNLPRGNDSDFIRKTTKYFEVEVASVS